MRHRPAPEGTGEADREPESEGHQPQIQGDVQPQGVEGERRMEQQAQDQHQGTQDDKGQQPGAHPGGTAPGEEGWMPPDKASTGS